MPTPHASRAKTSELSSRRWVPRSARVQPDTGLPAHIWVTQAVSCENGNAVKSGAKCKNNNAISHSES